MQSGILTNEPCEENSRHGISLISLNKSVFLHLVFICKLVPIEKAKIGHRSDTDEFCIPIWIEHIHIFKFIDREFIILYNIYYIELNLFETHQIINI